MRLTPEVKGWIEKAEQDYRGAITLARRRTAPVPDLVCFHCQQCVEKYLKALLLRLGDVRSLTPYAVMFRYPGENATPEDVCLSLAVVRHCRSALRLLIGWPRKAVPRTRR